MAVRMEGVRPSSASRCGRNWFTTYSSMSIAVSVSWVLVLNARSEIIEAVESGPPAERLSLLLLLLPRLDRSAT